MTMSRFYIAAVVVILVAIALMVFLTRKGRHQERLSTLGGMAFALVLAGLFFGEDRLLGYGLLAVGVTLAIIDVFRRRPNR
jgi:membrane-bound ClpP family serine protease